MRNEIVFSFFILCLDNEPRYTFYAYTRDVDFGE